MANEQNNKIKKPKLNHQQELFCQLFATEKEFFGNGVQSYIEAYNIDLSKKGAYRVARASASRLLTNVSILERINELLDLGGFNDQNVDKQLMLVIQQNADYSSKVSAIREYNKLKARIIEKAEVKADISGKVDHNVQVSLDDRIAKLVESAKKDSN